MIEETDETLFWIELLIEAEIIPLNRLESIMHEATEIVK